MNFYLTNEHRKYMGLKPIKDNYELKIIKKNEYQEYYLFFDNNKIVKLIEYIISEYEIYMRESDVNYETDDNKSVVLPKTERGSKRKLTGPVIDTFNGEGNYFCIQKRKENKYGIAWIGNYTTQKTFYKDEYIENINSLSDIENWCKKYVSESSEQDLIDVQKFANEKRKHCSFKEGDYFRVKIGRCKYTYGRILMDIYKREKNKTLDYWDVLMCRPLIIEVFHILTSRKDVSIDELKNLKTFPSQHIADNCFYYGEYEIIGNEKLPEELNYPILYGRSICSSNRDIVHFQCGYIHIEKEYNKNKFFGDYLNNGIGFEINQDERTIEKCIKENSNKPFWDHYPHYSKQDLRSPENRDKLIAILSEYNLENLLSIETE